MGGGVRANLTFQGQLRAFREAVSMKYKTEVGPDHVLMGWMVRHCTWVVNNVQVKGTGRTPYRSIRSKDCTGDVVSFGEVCLGRNHSEDGAKLNMRWMRGVFVGKLDRTYEFLLLTPTGAMMARCVRRLEGDNAWDLQFLNVCVGSPRNATARSTQQGPTIQQKDELAIENVRKDCTCDSILDKHGRTGGCPGCAGIGQHTEECRARIEQEMADKGDAIKLERSGNQEEIVQEPDVNLKKRKIGEPDINPGGESSVTADTLKRGESEQGSSADNESLLVGCIVAVNELFCDTPSVDLNRDRTALCGKFPEDEWKVSRELELRNMLNFDAFELVEECCLQENTPVTWFWLMSGEATE